MDNGWDQSAAAWIADQGTEGDWTRRWVLDPVVLPRVLDLSPRVMLDVGCGEGRACRWLRAKGVRTVGLDPTQGLIDAAQQRDARGTYVRGIAEHLPFATDAFDVVLCYMSLIDVSDIDAAIPGLARVLAPAGTLLVANLSSFNTAAGERGWVKGPLGERLHYPVDNYLDEWSFWTAYRGIRIRNHHRPLSRYMQLFLRSGLTLTAFDEPAPIAGAPKEKADGYRRAPYACVMEWRKTR